MPKVVSAAIDGDDNTLCVFDNGSMRWLNASGKWGEPFYPPGCEPDASEPETAASLGYATPGHAAEAARLMREEQKARREAAIKRLRRRLECRHAVAGLGTFDTTEARLQIQAAAEDLTDLKIILGEAE